MIDNNDKLKHKEMKGGGCGCGKPKK